ncbi:MAG: alpha/beta fold hydrolase, partial [Candidatus Limnocylindria bacterium]
SETYLGRRRCPVLALYADPQRAHLEEGLRRDDGSRVVTFEGSGHWLHQERSIEVNVLIETWIDSLAR